MILITSRAMRGVKILNRKQTCDELITLFKVCVTGVDPITIRQSLDTELVTAAL